MEYKLVPQRDFKSSPYKYNYKYSLSLSLMPKHSNTDPPRFECLPFYGTHKRAVSSVQLAPSRLTKGGLCASASADGTVKIWDITGDPKYETEEQSPPQQPGSTSLTAAAAAATTTTTASSSIATTNTNNTLNNHSTTATSTNNSNDKTLRRAMSPVEKLVGHSRGINEVCWSKSGDPFIATASDDKTARLWDAQTGDALVEFRGHDNFVFACDFNPTSNLLATGSFDETVKIWDVRNGDCVATLPAHSDPVSAVAFNRDGTCIVSASHDGLIRIWDVCTGECLKTIVAAGNPPVSHVTYSPNGRYVLAGTLDSTLRLWPLSPNSGTAKCAKTYTSENHVNTKYCITNRFLVAQPHRRQCVVTGSETGHVILYDLQSRQVHQTLDKIHQDAVLAIDVHDSMELIVSGGMTQDCTVRFWAPEEAKRALKRWKKE